jgi:DNA-binding transcriptional LysR family regulator
MNWTDLQHFLAVASGDGLSSAARNLGVSQVTVWRHIKRLEEVLQVRLFEDRKSGYVVSPAGRRLLETARRMEVELTATRQALSGSDAHLIGEVRLTAPEMVGSELLAENLSDFRARHPRLRIELVTGNPAVGLSRRETDIALRYDGSAQGDFLIARRFAVGFGVYATREYVTRNGAPEAIDRFDGHTLITFDDSPGHVAPARWQLKGGKGGEIAFRSNSLHARIAVAMVGTGCTLMPCILGDRHGDLVQVLSPRQVGSLELFVFINRRIQNSPRVSVTARFVVELLEARREALAGGESRSRLGTEFSAL